MRMRLLPILLIAALTAPLTAQEPPPDPNTLSKAFPGESYSPYAKRSFPSFPLWGDTHLHTSTSFDAGAFGNRLDARAAYRFAKGEEVTSSTGVPARLSRPLDWLVVADHSDNMGLFDLIYARDRSITSDPEGKRIADMIAAGGDRAVAASLELIDAFSRGTAISPALAVEPGVTWSHRGKWTHWLQNE